MGHLKLHLFLGISLLSAASHAEVIKVSSAILRTETSPFETHSGAGPFDSYLVMNIPFEPVKRTFDALNKSCGGHLVNRNEAHITVITPPEYNEILKNYVSMDEINAIALQSKIQNSKFTLKCLGRGRALLSDNWEETYYLVVQSSDLVRIRSTIFKKYISKGGEPSRFDPENFYAHITVGFTKADLHETNGVKKGLNSCVSDIELQ